MMRTPLRILLVLTSQATMGDELLNREWFRSRTEAKVLIERWRQFYNEQRPQRACLQTAGDDPAQLDPIR